ncbi:PEGA domain protein [Pseudodesulfovibrio hydrargyri]|uniref:PEGA domain protein n=1 Tax=Pseudodesulfovibrio hydrargyri TaxID=2125990 RepID=A0A1J5N0D0_9BACT|nr:PEGA domain-containing protein [Pseudodesulfovibrio hydrargyri]OIQ49107.1 PEGA domain protein [Pseudodesulfovibrio hydrargyri]
MARIAHVLACLACLLPVCACGVPMQRVPVSTDPLGATVYADGEKKCSATPCSVNLDRQSDHLLTIVKDGYEQEEIVLRRRFKPERAIRDGVVSGMILGDGPGGVASRTAKKVDEQERTGEAYELEPSIVTIKLTPKGAGI